MISTTACGLPTGSSSSIQASLQPTEANRKRPRSKHLTWAGEDKLNQVRLFAAEDAPSLSGSVLQELLEAKKTKFVHASVPASLDDVPPGFERALTKRARLDSASILAMVAQITWHYPEKLSFNSLWQVAMGDESSEVKLQRQRELRILEAVYPRPSAVPSSSMEPPEIPIVQQDSQVIEIPLIPIEDDDDGLEEENLSGGVVSCQDSGSATEIPWTYPPGYSPSKDVQNLNLKSQSKGGSSSAVAQFNGDLTSALFKNDDPDVAAAAAAAFAVVKAKESGALIDHDLLIKILSNPVLIESLTASNPKLRKQFGDISSSYRNRANANSSLKIRSEQSQQERPLTGPTNSSGPFHVQGAQMYDTPGLRTAHSLGYNANGFPLSHDGRGYLTGGAGGGYANVGPPGHQQYPIIRHNSREFIQHHGMPDFIVNDHQFRQPDEIVLGHHDSEWYRSGNLWAGTSSSALPQAGLGKPPQDKPAGLKSKKQCFFFNTPKGCRNGVYCPFSHDLTSENLKEEREPDETGSETKSYSETEGKASDANPK